MAARGAGLPRPPEPLAARLASGAASPLRPRPNAASETGFGQPSTEPYVPGPSGNVWFTESRATCALMELDTVFSGFSFQTNFRHLSEKSPEAAPERRRLILGVLGKVLPTFGLEPDVESALRLLDVIRALCKRDSSAARLEALLRLGLQAQAASASGDAQKDASAPLLGPGDVKVRIRERPAAGKEAREVHVVVQPTATLSEVLSVAAAKLGDTSVLATGSFVKLGPSSATVYTGEELLGARRRLLLVRDRTSTGSTTASAPAMSPAVMPAMSPGRGRVVVCVEHSKERLDVWMQPGDTVNDLRRRLEELVATLPQNYMVMARAKSGGALVHLQNSVAPLPRKVVLKGVASLSKDVHLIDEEFIEVLRSISQGLRTTDFQEKVRVFKEAASAKVSGAMQDFRAEFRKVLNPPALGAGFEDSEEGYKKWQMTMDEFERFPAVGEAIRKYRILAGTMQPEKAQQARIKHVGGRGSRNPVFYPRGADRKPIYELREIPSEFALVAERERASAAFDLLYRRIYEDNTETLWGGAANMPTFEAVEWKYLEPAGATLLHCSVATSPWKVPSAAVVHPIRVKLQAALNPWKIGEPVVDAVEVESSEAEEIEEEDPVISVGYISGLAVQQGSQAGPMLIEHLLGMAKEEGWRMLVLHCIGVERSRNFFSRQGFSAYGPGKEMPFQMAMTQHCGVGVRRDAFERQLPSRPQCLLHVKFVSGGSP